MAINKEKIKEKALQLGYSSCGIIPATPFEEYRDALDERIKSFPESEKLYEPLYGLVNPHEKAKSIIVCIRGYTQYKIPKSLQGRIGKYYLFSRYAPYSYENRSKNEFESYLIASGIQVLNENIPARAAAVKAGLGHFGCNTFFYTKEHGSYNGIDIWVVDKVLDYDIINENVMAPGCGGEKCNKCVQACPTKALDKCHSMNRGRCLPSLLYSKKEPTKEDSKLMGKWLFGCDICQDVCPLNHGKFTETEEFPLLSQLEPLLQPEAILTMDEYTYLKAVHPQFPFAGKDGLPIWKRNASRALLTQSDNLEQNE